MLHYWPELIRRLENGREKFHLKCAICTTASLVLPAEVLSPDASTIISQIYDGGEHIAVLPCGHFYGNRCLKKWLRQSCATLEDDDDDELEDGDEDDEDGLHHPYSHPTCPDCRQKLLFPRCGHALGPAQVYAYGTLELFLAQIPHMPMNMERFREKFCIACRRRGRWSC